MGNAPVSTSDLTEILTMNCRMTDNKIIIKALYGSDNRLYIYKLKG